MHSKSALFRDVVTVRCGLNEDSKRQKKKKNSNSNITKYEIKETGTGRSGTQAED